MQVYGSILPGAATLARLLPEQTARLGAEVKLPREAQHRLKVIHWHEEHGRNVRKTADHFGYSRPTIYAWLKRFQRAGPKGLVDRSHRPLNVRKSTWSSQLEQEVLQLREQFPHWGKDKLAVLLRNAGTVVSTSMVGRILKHLKATGQLVEALPEPRRKGKAIPRTYAVRKPKGYLVKEPGDLVEVDTVDLRPLPGVVLKHFTSCDLISRWGVLGVYWRATASSASDFLDAMQARMPFPIKAIQVDGGSEFKADFESLCRERDIRLFVLPPRSPELNGCVERSNRTHREEFYNVYDLEWTVTGLRPQLLWWEGIYDTLRPHKALGYLTPQQYVTQWRLARAGKEVV